MRTAQEVFDQAVTPLPARERLQLAALILQELAGEDPSTLPMDHSWSEQDERDVTLFSLRHAEARYPESEELV